MFGWILNPPLRMTLEQLLPYTEKKNQIKIGIQIETKFWWDFHWILLKRINSLSANPTKW